MLVCFTSGCWLSVGYVRLDDIKIQGGYGVVSYVSANGNPDPIHDIQYNNIEAIGLTSNLATTFFIHKVDKGLNNYVVPKVYMSLTNIVITSSTLDHKSKHFDIDGLCT